MTGGRLGILCNYEKIIGGAVQKDTHGFNVLISDGFGLVVDHFAEILITHAKLLIQPVFGLALFFQNP